MSDRAKAVLTGGLAALLGTTCLVTGGVASWAFPLLILAPFSGLVTGSLRSVRSASSVSIISAITLPFVTNMQTLPLGLGGFGIVLLGTATGAAIALASGRAIHGLKQGNEIQSSQYEFLALQTESLVSKHDKSGSTMLVSRNAQRITGCSSDELATSGFYERVHLQDRVAFLKCLQDASQSPVPTHCQFRMHCKSAEKQVWRWMEMECFPRDTADQEVTAITKDISYLKLLETSLDEATQQLVEADLTKTSFLGTVSHELRTPLNAIIGFSDILKQEIFGKLANERQREHVSHIQDAGNHLLGVVNTMLDLSRIEAGKYELSSEIVDLKSIVRTCITILDPLCDKHGVKIEVNIGAFDKPVRGDENAIKQILINLLSNAVKFSPVGEKVRLRLEATGTEYKLIVEDHGIGISDDFKVKLGKPFEQADRGRDRSFEGTGLGLSVVNGLVKLHKGTVDFDSVEGAGTIVAVTLPLQLRTAAPVPADETIRFIRKTDLREKSQSPNSEDTIPASKGESRARLSA